MILKLTHLFILLQVSKCSMVIDSHGQNGIYVSDFCPDMKYCTEGSHVMCMFYNPKQIYGPRCSNPQNMTITPELANHLLDITNAIRSKIANGKEKGKDNVQLPRGYGIFRLKWDNELATFAQVLANQCVLRHDLCRSTKKFPDPGQTAGMMRLTAPDWKPIHKQANKPAIDAPGLNPEKLIYIMTQVLKSWYSQKTSITEEMIENYPDWSLIPNVPGRVYLELIHGPATHMGCGTTAYTEFNYFQRQPINGKPGGINYNTVLLICNFSSRPKIGEQTYLTTRPPYSSLCGCPEGTQEDSDCLCVESSLVKEPKETNLSLGVPATHETCASGNCEQTLVLLPIFTIEDAPPEKLIDSSDTLTSFSIHRFDNRSNAIQRMKSMEIFDFFQDAEKEHQKFHNPAVQHPLDTKLSMPFGRSISPYIRKAGETSNNIFEQEPIEMQLPELKERAPKTMVKKKSSIFTRVAPFELPNKRKSDDQNKLIKYDVKPRKDFKNIQRVVNEYLNNRDTKLGNKKQKNIVNNLEGILKTPYMAASNIQENTETILNNAEEKRMDFSQYTKLKHNITFSKVESSDKTRNDVKYDESDTKLLDLLDNLEQEVKHIKLDRDEKEIFEAKIKKIYGSIVGVPSVLVITTSPIPKQLLSSQPALTPSIGNIESDFMESDIGGPKAYLHDDTNHPNEMDILTRRKSNHHFSGDTNSNKLDTNTKINRLQDYKFYDRKYKNNQKYGKSISYKDIDIENKSFNENEMFENDPKLFSDVEHKYNSLGRGLNKSIRKYSFNKDDKFSDILVHKYNNDLDNKYDDLESKYGNIPARNQNNIETYESSRHRQNPNVDTENKYRERELRIRSNDLDNNRDTVRRHDTRNSKRDKKNNQEHDDVLSEERRKYYQNMLENAERKLQKSYSYQHRINKDRANAKILRRTRPNLEDSDRPKSKLKEDSFYVPDRARFLHGF